jgi:hypothetical protein
MISKQRKRVWRIKLFELKKASDDAFDELKAGVEMAWEDVVLAYNSAISVLKDELNK